MAEITLRGNPIHTVGDLPAVGSPAPAFTLTGGTLGDVTAGDFAGKSLVLNIFPSIDTGVCAASVRAFNETRRRPRRRQPCSTSRRTCRSPRRASAVPRGSRT